ncbi:MAG: tail fiber domain-containing protein, partial [Proteobacteria bacterium]
GNVGIGTTTPSEKLVVANGTSAIKFTPGWFSSTGSWIDLDTTGPSGIGTGGPGANPWLAYVSGPDQWFHGTAAGDVVYRNTYGKKIHLGINNATGDANPLITLNGSKVGIGTINPSTQLQVTSDGDTAITIASNAASRVAQLSIYRGPGRSSSVGPSANNTFDFWTQENIPIYFSLNSSERMRIDTSGNVSVGQSNPGMNLNVNGNIRVANAYKLYVGAVAVCDNTGCSSPSDRRYKESIMPLTGSLDKLLSLHGVSYDWIDKEAFNRQHQIGFIAQDVEKVFPEVVKTDEKTGFKSVVYDHLTAPIIEALKTLVAKIESKASRDEMLRNANELQVQISALKQENENFPKYTFKRTDDNASFVTSDGKPLQQNGSNGIPFILNTKSGNLIPSFGFIFEF